jgi:hypothetical protein
METGCWELIATNESTIIAKSVREAFVVENSECDCSFPDPPRTDESDGFQVFCESNDLFDERIPPETGAWWWGRYFSWGNTTRK